MKNTDRIYRNIAITGMILLLMSFAVPALAEMEADFDYEMYRIDTSEWGDNPEYKDYTGIIYKVDFFDRTTGGTPKSWYWDFDDEWESSTKQNPTHIYTKTGQYTVKLTVTDSSGKVAMPVEKKFFADDDWGVYTKITPTPTPRPTPVKTPTPKPVVTQTPVPTTPTPAPNLASHTIKIPVISGEMDKLQNTYNDYISLIKALFGIITD
ncbi:PKD domain-containing protein [Methanoplanus sp. FWC-SCC4]|uniref:PKD domain-containing protein n=1 Tax=Methanochimaera problematica TaxID=2609417 RepID=A0AA97FAU1_9EURY|nr:PKD domain-containing protein [Methanoplanus sp. FWC-SCC4]WOF15965.1 PKD domain-containing protein [Methanoplanus sp. FWC-SCC4]